MHPERGPDLEYQLASPKPGVRRAATVLVAFRDFPCTKSGTPFVQFGRLWAMPPCLVHPLPFGDLKLVFGRFVVLTNLLVQLLKNIVTKTPRMPVR